MGKKYKITTCFDVCVTELVIVLAVPFVASFIDIDSIRVKCTFTILQYSEAGRSHQPSSGRALKVLALELHCCEIQASFQYHYACMYIFVLLTFYGLLLWQV